MGTLDRLVRDMFCAWETRCALPLRRAEVERLEIGGLRVRLGWGADREVSAIVTGPERVKLFVMAVAMGAEAERAK